MYKNGEYVRWSRRNCSIKSLEPPPGREEEMMRKLLEQGKVALEPGTKYGEEGRGLLRMNVACAPQTAKDGVQRFIKALS